jgi:hypothetical protein
MVVVFFVIVRCCGLSKIWYGGEGCDLPGSWLVLLESAKDMFLGVDPPPIRETSTNVLDLVEWRGIVNTSLILPSARGATVMGNLSNATVL